MDAELIVPIDHVWDLRIERIDPGRLLLLAIAAAAAVACRSATGGAQYGAQRSVPIRRSERLVESLPKSLDSRTDPLVHLLEYPIHQNRQRKKRIRNG